MIDKSLRIVFGGTPDFAASHLQYLIDEGYNIVAVYTQPDREAGRGKKVCFSPVKEIALKYSIPVEQPSNFKNSQDCETFEKYNSDLFVVVAYGIILPKIILDAPKYGCINVHGSLLPKYRGAAPIQRAIYFGETKTGITIMRMNEKLDEGDIILKEELPIEINDTSETLFNKLLGVGKNLLAKTVDLIEQNQNIIPTEKQNHEIATYAQKISKQEAQLKFDIPAKEIHQHIRAYIPWPVAYITVNDQNIKIWEADVIEENTDKLPGTIVSINKNGIQVATSSGQLLIKSMQLPGKKNMNIANIINGHPELFKVGQVL